MKVRGRWQLIELRGCGIFAMCTNCHHKEILDPDNYKEEIIDVREQYNYCMNCWSYNSEEVDYDNVDLTIKKIDTVEQCKEYEVFGKEVYENAYENEYE